MSRIICIKAIHQREFVVKQLGTFESGELSSIMTFPADTSIIVAFKHAKEQHPNAVEFVIFDPSNPTPIRREPE